jgi:hypothetical protein
MQKPLCIPELMLVKRSGSDERGLESRSGRAFMSWFTYVVLSYLQHKHSAVVLKSMRGGELVSMKVLQVVPDIIKRLFRLFFLPRLYSVDYFQVTSLLFTVTDSSYSCIMISNNNNNNNCYYH